MTLLKKNKQQELAEKFVQNFISIGDGPVKSTETRRDENTSEDFSTYMTTVYATDVGESFCFSCLAFFLVQRVVFLCIFIPALFLGLQIHHNLNEVLHEDFPYIYIVIFIR